MVGFTLCGIAAAAVLAIGVLQFLWGNSQYQLSAAGIKVVCLYHTQDVEWKDVRDISIRPVYILRGQPRDYIIVRMSEALPHSDDPDYIPDLTACWLQREKFLAVRSTELMVREFQKYWKRTGEAPYPSN